MNYIKSYRQYNEGLKSKLAGAGLAATLAFGTPEVSLAKSADTTQYIPRAERDLNFFKTHQKASELSEIRKKEEVKDGELSLILDEIQDNLNTHDSSKYVELFNKLSTHLEKNYGYKIEARKIENVEPEGMSLAAILGWLGSICLAICGIPQALMSYKDKHSHGISWSFLLLWAFGELFALAYVYDKLDLPLLLNYAINILIVSVILYYKVRPQAELTFDSE